jgi:hypothetical protein
MRIVVMFLSACDVTLLLEAPLLSSFFRITTISLPYSYAFFRIHTGITTYFYGSHVAAPALLLFANLASMDIGTEAICADIVGLIVSRKQKTRSECPRVLAIADSKMRICVRVRRWAGYPLGASYQGFEVVHSKNLPVGNRDVYRLKITLEACRDTLNLELLVLLRTQSRNVWL